MDDESLITDEIKNTIGKVGESYAIEIERGMIKRLTEAIGDDNPLWRDRGCAIKNGYGDIACPPALLLTLLFERGKPMEIPIAPSLKRLDGGGKWEFYKQIMPGDVIICTPSFANAYEKEGKAGKMLFLVSAVTWKNQLGEIVGKSEATTICSK